MYKKPKCKESLGFVLDTLDYDSLEKRHLNKIRGYQFLQ